MDAKELAQAMLEWGNLQEKADALKQVIEAEVVAIGKSQTVGNVHCTFSNPRKVYQTWVDAVLAFHEQEEV